MGQPGSPGGNDLTRALHRLSLRRHNFLSERQFFHAEREKKLQSVAGAEADVEGSCCSSQMGSMHSSYSNLSELSFSSCIFKTFLPEKLQIVKPMEGIWNLPDWLLLLSRSKREKCFHPNCLVSRFTDAPSLAAAGPTAPGHHPGSTPRRSDQGFPAADSGCCLPPV